jgi:hypothetical protein
MTLGSGWDRVEWLLGLKLIVKIIKSHSLLHAHWGFKGRNNFAFLGYLQGLTIINDLPKVNSSIFFSQGSNAK